MGSVMQLIKLSRCDQEVKGSSYGKQPLAEMQGVALAIGLKSSLQFFMKHNNYKGTTSFGAGFFFVVIGWPILGMILEASGFIVLFSGFWPTLPVFLQKIPILGWIFQQPFFRSIQIPVLAG